MSLNELFATLEEALIELERLARRRRHAAE